MALNHQFLAWADQLVDLSGRNELISFKVTKTTTLQLNDEVAENLLRGGEFPLRDLFDLTESSTRTLVRKVLSVAEDNAEQFGIETLTLISGFADWESERVSSPHAPFHLIDAKVKGSSATPERCHLCIDRDSEKINPVFLQHLRSIAGFSIEDEMIDEALNSGVDAVRKLLIDQLPPQLQLRFSPGFFIKNLSYQKLPMVENLRSATTALEQHPVIAALAGDSNALRSLQQQRVSSTRKDPNSTPSREEFLILDADASQQWAINTALEGHNLVIEGPPGTGKSQTIANLIAACMARGRSVLFVAEKRAAIDAVKKRIDRVGLGELLLDLHDASTLRSRPAKPFADALDALTEIPNVDLEYIHRPLDEAKQNLLAHNETLHKRQEPWGCSYYEIGAMLLERPSTDRPSLRLIPQELQAIDRKRLDQIRTEIKEIGALSAAEVLNPDWLFAPAVRNGTLAKDGAVENLLELSDAIAPQVQILKSWTTSLSPVVRSPENLSLTTLASLAQDLHRLFDKLSTSLDVEALIGLPASDRAELTRQLAKGARKRLRDLIDRRHKLAIEQAIMLSRHGNISELPRALNLIEQLSKSVSPLRRIESSERVAEAVRSIRQFLGELQKLGLLLPAAEAPCSEWLAVVHAVDADRKLLIQAGPIVQRLAKFEECGAQKTGLIDFLVEHLSAGAQAERLCQAVSRAWAFQVEEKIALREPLLSEARRERLDGLVNRFRFNDRQSIEATPLKIRRLVAERAHELRLSDQGKLQERLIRSEALKGRRKGRLTARRLFELAPELLTALKPCWAMSPLVVSQLLPADRQHFDLVIFDEASQIVPFEAVTSILRGRQVVVAGDSKQLSPTSTTFFGSRNDDEDNDPADLDDEGQYEMDAVKEAESLLDAMKSCLPPLSGIRMLQWHYRSEDERLIAFSNAHPDLYNRKLITLPGTASNPPFAYRLVEGQQSEVSGASPNAEVECTAALAIDLLQRDPEQSLAVIAFGVTHAARIQKAFNKKLDSLGGALQLHPADRPEEKFRIRNLETIQGDERDVVILATGYGLTKTGKPSYNFGPINHDENLQGLRRLNVAITRARKRVEVVTTINPDLYDTNKLDKIGTKAFIDYLRFCRSGGKELGDLSIERPPLNPFEEDILTALSAAGLKLVPQHGVSGYRLDFAVQHPVEPGRFVLAIEADGATYHSSDTARDRDRIRQEHLEGKGWRFHRIWSTEWIHNREQEIAAAIKAYEQAVRDSDSLSPSPAESVETESVQQELISSSAKKTRPAIPQRKSIVDYSEAELLELVRWWQSDGILRSDDEIIAGLVPELGFQRRGRLIVDRLTSVIQQCREKRMIS
jgi:very-short-patch-repair endonuclease